MRVFISHSSADNDMALRLAAELRNAGLTPWTPAMILPGDNWARETGDALESSDIMVVLLTRTMKDKVNLQRDVQFALTSGHYNGRVVPACIGFTTFRAGKDVPWILLRLDPVYIPERNPREFNIVIERVRSLAAVGSHVAE